MINLFSVHVPESVTRPLLDVLFSGMIGQFEKVEEFEKGLFKWLQTTNVLTLNNGTAGLHLAFHLAGVGHGDEVITSPMSCLATHTPIVAMGAKPIWADIDPLTGNIDSNKIEELITIKTKAILPIHFGGYPCDLDEINQIALSHGIYVIEDAAHAFGSTYKGQRIGSISDFTMFSLQAIKHITTGDGGILTCKNKDHYKRGKLLRWYGLDRELDGQTERLLNDVPECGYKYHMNDLAAVLGLEQLKYIEGILFKHWENANYYDIEIEKRKLKRVKRLKYATDRASSYWLYTLLVDDRDAFIKHMAEKGVACGAPHVRTDNYSCFKTSKRDGLVGVAEFDAKNCAIPCHWAVTPEDRKTIIEAMASFDKQ